MISKGASANFNTLLRAAHEDEIALMECTAKVTGKPVNVICAVNRIGKEFAFVPLAKLFDGNPYEEVDPPMADENDKDDEKLRRAGSRSGRRSKKTSA